MKTVLLVSKSEKSLGCMLEMLGEGSRERAALASDCGQARRLAAAQDYALTIIEAPLPDGSGAELARYAARTGGGQVLLLTGGPEPEGLEDEGILVLKKPVSRALFACALKAAAAAQSRLSRAQEENRRLQEKMEDIRLVDRAKCILISQMNMREEEAHRYLEKQAMDRRTTKRAVAEGILKTYEI